MFNDLEVLPGRYKCDINGVGMMVRKDSELPQWWNAAFKQYYMSGQYNDDCDQINQKYGGKNTPHPLKTIKEPHQFEGLFCRCHIKEAI